jgi:16S rRNA (guanine(966)-N(2))-methyltransferase RsmD
MPSNSKRLELNKDELKTARVITGSAKSIPLLIPPKSRAITDRAKTSLFSMLGPDIVDKKILDLFAGSGALGIECLSRGAKSAVFVDQSKKAEKILKANLSKTKLSSKADVRREEVFQFLAMQQEKSFDIVFADPPFDFYEQGSYRLRHLVQEIYPIIPDKGAIIVKHPYDIDPPADIKNMILGVNKEFGQSAISLWVKKIKND